MTKKTCDRCGVEIKEYAWTPVMFPWYSIIRVNSFAEKAESVDLCRKCTADLDKWLKTKPEADDENNA